jgi:hypothetical protein
MPAAQSPRLVEKLITDGASNQASDIGQVGFENRIKLQPG